MNNSPFSNASSIPSVLGSCEFVVLVPVPAVAVLNCWMLYRSALLHPNLKTILIVQSVAILFYAMQRLLSGLNLYKIAIAIADDTITFSNLIGHFLIIERTVATLWARDYAKWKSRWINLIWMLVVLIIVAFDLLYPTFNGGTANRIGATVIFTHIALLLSVAEIVAFSALHVHNQRSLGWANHQQQYNLGERYQLVENFYAGEQLRPCFLFHLVNIMCSNVVCVLFVYQLPVPSQFTQIAFAAIYLAQALAKLATEITVITFHPKLNRDLRAILARIFSPICCRREANNRVADANANRQQIASERQQEADAHFKMLKSHWN